MTAKQEFINIINSEPDNISAEELAYEARVYSDIIVSLNEIEEGKITPHEEVKEMIESWE